MDRGRGEAGVQSAEAEAVGWLPRSLRSVASGRLSVGLPRRKFRDILSHPGDFDACWDIQGVDEEVLDPVFWDFSEWSRGTEAAVRRRVLPDEQADRRARRESLRFG
jgi:hypothetical protein